MEEHKKLSNPHIKGTRDFDVTNHAYLYGWERIFHREYYQR